MKILCLNTLPPIEGVSPFEKSYLSSIIAQNKRTSPDAGGRSFICCAEVPSHHIQEFSEDLVEFFHGGDNLRLVVGEIHLLDKHLLKLIVEDIQCF